MDAEKFLKHLHTNYYFSQCLLEDMGLLLTSLSLQLFKEQYKRILGSSPKTLWQNSKESD